MLNSQPQGPTSGGKLSERVFRKPRRITVTVPDQIYRSLLERSSREGRSISNLAAYLLERAVGQSQPAPELAADSRLIV